MSDGSTLLAGRRATSSTRGEDAQDALSLRTHAVLAAGPHGRRGLGVHRETPSQYSRRGRRSPGHRPEPGLCRGHRRGIPVGIAPVETCDGPLPRLSARSTKPGSNCCGQARRTLRVPDRASGPDRLRRSGPRRGGWSTTDHAAGGRGRLHPQGAVLHRRRTLQPQRRLLEGGGETLEPGHSPNSRLSRFRPHWKRSSRRTADREMRTVGRRPVARDHHCFAISTPYPMPGGTAGTG